MAERIEDELLVALADGELPTEAAEQLQKLVDQDPDAAKRLEAFKASRDTLRGVFNAENLELTPVHIAEKIRGMGKQEDAGADVVQFDVFKERRERVEEQRRFSFRGIQRYAAMLILGGAIGFGVSGELVTAEKGRSGPLSESYHALRGVPKSTSTMVKNDQINRVQLILIDEQGNRFSSGEFAPRNMVYRLMITAPTGGSISVKYVEGSNNPETIIRGEVLEAKQPFTFPKTIREGVKFETDQPIVSFIATFNGIPAVYSFGLMD